MPHMSEPKRRRRRTRNAPAAISGDLVPAQTAAAPVPVTIDDHIEQKMAESHPIYGAFGHVFKEIGGVDALADWAQDEPGKFYAIFAKMVPQESGQNQINIQINAKLAPGALDT